MKYYIAYGSNLDKTQMAMRCPESKPIARGWLKNYRLVFQGNKYGAHANVIPDQEEDTPVAIWEISKRDEANLDMYEGVAGGYYTKEYMTIKVNGEQKKGLIYIMTPHGFGTPAQRYFETIRKGYADFNLPVRKLQQGLQYSIDRMTKEEQQ